MINSQLSTLNSPKSVRVLLHVTCSDQAPDCPSTLNSQPSTPRDPTASQLSPLNSQPVLDFIASTGAVDRYREIIEPEGWRLDSYRRNPVFQNAHRYGDVLFTLGKALVTEVRELADGRKALFQRIEFATEINPVARIAYGLYRGGFLSAVSVGFIPLRWEEGTDKTPFSRRYLEQELLEVSAVAIPANSEALALGLAAGAVTRSAVQEAFDLLRVTLNAPQLSTLNSQPSQELNASQLSTLNSQLLWSFARQLRAAMRN